MNDFQDGKFYWGIFRDSENGQPQVFKYGRHPVYGEQWATISSDETTHTHKLIILGLCEPENLPIQAKRYLAEFRYKWANSSSNPVKRIYYALSLVDLEFYVQNFGCNILSIKELTTEE